MKFFKRIKGQIELIPIAEPQFHSKPEGLSPAQIDEEEKEKGMSRWLFEQILLCNAEGSILIGVSGEEAATYVTEAESIIRDAGKEKPANMLESPFYGEDSSILSAGSLN